MLTSFLVSGAASRVRADVARWDSIADTYVVSGLATQSFGQNRTMRIGYDQFGGYQIERSLIKFLPNSIPVGSQVTSARLWLNLSGSTKDDAPLTIEAYQRPQSVGQEIPGISTSRSP